MTSITTAEFNFLFSNKIRFVLKIKSFAICNHTKKTFKNKLKRYMELFENNYVQTLGLFGDWKRHFHFFPSSSTPHSTSFFLSFDPLGRPTVMADSDHYFRTWCLYFRPSVRLYPISKSRKIKQFSSENSNRYWRDCGSGRVDHWWHLSFFLSSFSPLSHFHQTFERCSRQKWLYKKGFKLAQLIYKEL